MVLTAWLATIMSAAFAVVLLDRARRRAHPAYLIWALALACFAIGSGGEAVARLSAWTPATTRTFYIFGAGLTAGFLGVGTLMVAWRRAGSIAFALAAIASLLIIWQTLAAPIDEARLPAEGYEALARPPLLRIPVILMNAVGTLLVIVPTIQSALRAARARESWSRTLSLVLVVVGVLIIAGGHSLAGLLRLAPAAAISLVNAVGVAVMFAGFMLPTIGGDRRRTAR